MAAVLAVFLLVAAVQQQQQQEPSLPGTLTKPIAQYTGNEFAALTRSLAYTGGVERGRRCRDRAECRAARRTRVRVDAVQGVDSLSRTNIPPYGIIAARAINRGADREDMYGMRPGARYEYYLIVHPPADSVSLPTWQLEQLEIAGSQRTISSVNSGILRPCYHPFVRGARADFKTCAEAMARPASFGNLLQEADGGPLWISCSYGCCTSEAGAGGS